MTTENGEPKRESARDWAGCAISATARAIREIDEAMLAALPLEVVEHLQEGRKHLAIAASRVAELQIEKAEQAVRRAREVHERVKASRAAGDPPSPGEGI